MVGNVSDRFIRTRALYGDDAFEKLKNSRVAVFGLGGVGGFTAEALIRSGVGALDLVDPDVFDITNINRQLFATGSTIGKLKTLAAKQRLSDINPSAAIETYELFYCNETAGSIDLAKYDAVADAIDSLPGKLELAERAFKAGVKLVSCMGVGKKTDPSRLRISPLEKTTVCPLARKMRTELKKRGISGVLAVWSDELPVWQPADAFLNDGNKFIASGAIVPAVAGLLLADAIIKIIISS